MKKLCFVLVLAVASLWAEKLDFYGYLKKSEESFLAKDYKQAKNYFKKACEVNPSNGYCSNYTALGYFSRVCSSSDNGGYDNKDIELCMQLGDMYYEGNKELQVEKNIYLANEHWANALKRNYTYGAYSDSSNVPNAWYGGGGYGEYYDKILSYLEGRKKDESQKEVKQDYTKARILAEIACEKNVGQACEILGDIYAQGKGVKQDLAKAKSLYQKACENPRIDSGGKRGYAPCGGGYMTSYLNATYYGCKKLGDIYYANKNFSEARKWWAKAVEKNCDNCDYDYDEEIKIEDFEISGYYQEAEGYYKGYKEVSYFDEENNLITKKEDINHELDYNKAVILASIGCDDFKKEPEYCYILADAYTLGKGVAKDANKAQQYRKKWAQYHARDLYERAYKIGERICRAGDRAGDFEVTTFYYEDTEMGIEKERQKVAKMRAEIKVLLEKACALDKTSEACTALKNKAYEKNSDYIWID